MKESREFIKAIYSFFAQEGNLEEEELNGILEILECKDLKAEVTEQMLYSDEIKGSITQFTENEEDGSKGGFVRKDPKKISLKDCLRDENGKLKLGVNGEVLDKDGKPKLGPGGCLLGLDGKPLLGANDCLLGKKF